LKNIHKLTEGAILLAIFAVLLLLTLWVPILGAVVNLFISIPFIMFAAKNNRKAAGVFLVASIFISLIVGTFLAIPLTISYGLTGLVIGDFIQHKKGRSAVFIAASITYLLNLVVQYAVAVAFFKVDFIEQSIDLFKQSVEQSMNMLNTLGQEPNDTLFNQINAGIDMLQSLIPSLFVIGSFTAVFLIQLVSFPIVRRFGIEVRGWKPFRELTLPKNLLFYFLIAVIASLIINPENGSYINLALTNMVFILQLLMIVQGVSFIWYFSHLKGWPKAVPIFTTIALFVLPLLLYIVLIVGIMDLGLDLRKKLTKE
jgi:uncharacterized protein YybS (DUF2232 family)